MITQNQARLIAAIAAPLALLSLGTPAKCAPLQAAAPATAQVAMTQMDHISIQQIGTTGSPVILIPGLASPRATYDFVAEGLAQKHRVYLVQVNGFGGDDPRGNLKPGILDGMVSDLSAFITAQKLGTPAIIGHSMGGLAGLMFAKAHPDQIARLMVVGSLPYIGVIFAPGATVAMVEPQAKAIRDQMVANYGKPANPASAEAMANSMALTPEARAKVLTWMRAADVRVSGQAMYEDMTTDLRPDMASLKLPITLLYPTSDAAPAAGVEPTYKTAYANAPNVSMVPIEGSAHFIMLDKPGLFDVAVWQFLAGY